MRKNPASSTDQFRFIEKTITFTGAAGLGAIGNVPIYTITGVIRVIVIVPVCTVTLVGATATLALTAFIAATTATTITTTNNVWVTTTPAPDVAIPAACMDIAKTIQIVGVVATAAITAGAIRFQLWYQPLTAGAVVV